jgi:hypothetical protein
MRSIPPVMFFTSPKAAGIVEGEEHLQQQKKILAL